MVLVYSCCFWFSLRLGGILTALFSVFQALAGLFVYCFAHTHPQKVKDELSVWITNMDLMYAKGYLENIKEDLKKYTTFGIIFTCIYIFICLLYVYGAYTCNNMLMIGYILVELLRLIALSVLVATWLMVLKSNTMDIGLLIGASVIGGFLLLGMFYLWVCAANLPILINEIERDEQAATIAKLEHLLAQMSSKTINKAVYDIPIGRDYTVSNFSTDNGSDKYVSRLAIVLQNRDRDLSKPFNYLK